MSKPVRPRSSLPPDPNEILALVQRAEEGDASTLPALQELMRLPEVVEMLGGDLAREAQSTLISRMCDRNLVSQQALISKLHLLRAEIGGPNASPLERLLVERIVACWLHLYHLEWTYADNEIVSLKEGAYLQHCLDRAQKRYLSAIKTLLMGK